MPTAAEVGSVYQVADDYSVHFNSENYLILKMGAKCDQPSRFLHRNIVASCSRVFSFKHHYRDGRKSWTTTCGTEYYIVIPKDRIELVSEKGYSYVPAIIGGNKITLNVSGGTDGHGGWMDLVHRITDTSVGFPLKMLKSLANQALAPEECWAQNITFTLQLSDYDQSNYPTLATYVGIRNLLQPGHKIILASGWNGDNQGPFTIISRPPNKRYFICDYGHAKVRVKYKAIHWVKTAALNGLPVAEPFAWNKIGDAEIPDQLIIEDM